MQLFVIFLYHALCRKHNNLNSEVSLHTLAQDYMMNMRITVHVGSRSTLHHTAGEWRASRGRRHQRLFHTCCLCYEQSVHIRSYPSQDLYVCVWVCGCSKKSKIIHSNKPEKCLLIRHTHTHPNCSDKSSSLLPLLICSQPPLECGPETHSYNRDLHKYHFRTLGRMCGWRQWPPRLGS